MLRFTSLVAAIILLASAAGAQTLPGCNGDILGGWNGHVFDNNRLRPVTTDFSMRDGQLTGSYHVGENDDGYDGTLDSFRQIGPCSGMFTWHDRYGEGTVEIKFLPEIGRFDGRWGVFDPLIDNVFDGMRRSPTS